MAAGDSASRRAQEARRQERLLREQWRAALQEARRWEAAGEAERRVAAQLLVLTERGWRLLVDRRWPGTRAANVDMLLIGPGGVFVVDVKNWRHPPQVVEGKLRAGGELRDDHVRKLLAVTRTADSAVASLGLSPVAVQPLMVFAGQQLDAELGRLRLLGEREVGPALMKERIRLPPGSVRAIADHLERVFVEYEGSGVTSASAQGSGRAQVPQGDGLFDVESLREAALEEARRAPIEQWMTFLDAEQVPLVRRNWSGPARISGPAGTGKTVVALHRTAYLAAQTSGRILYVTFANNLPRVQATFLNAMSPSVADRVDFRSLHAWAQEFLHDRGVPVRLHREKAETAFSLAWKHVGRESCLAEIDTTPGYWRDEIDYVIKGRGITSFEEYAVVRRLRRRSGLRRTHREAVWALYEAYEAIREERGVHDFNDVLALALSEVAGGHGGTAAPYTAVIVDEVQDLTLVGVRLLHSLVGDAPNGLLLVGDGQQAVYPGGFRLSDAGIDIRGARGQVLRVNYRNSKEILEAALSVVADDVFEDIDGMRTPGRRDVELTYYEGQVQRAVLSTVAAHDQALVDALRALPPQEWAGAAVLCPSKWAIGQYQSLLTQAGIRVCMLEQYNGRPVEAVKLGSYRRAKGLEFKRVYLPRHDDALSHAKSTDGTPPGETAREREEIARSQLFVAMTRARDVLWLGSIRPGAS
ncbi:nuclease-related domain-containing DEAD/DEAH box helicase [Streptomyces purpurogeneiscleroticus]|uniref:nuclease-related domain-containing DEAD/DEAH box helicase n=1 Tax=Streptomyces purpurogeneiscleroticus TaxID=68259 RepID=UPI001CBC3DE4|nr:UvrD-helicase domain-containing protein [Streptomyces purpurogeneiscleroticus]MBZ4020084.1 NERD nuclease [Streptomyces purpurogeneiscleroticus]